MRDRNRVLVLAAFTSLLVLPATSALAAAPSGAGSFGQHVASCAHNGELNGNMNPGMHQGVRGWDGTACM